MTALSSSYGHLPQPQEKAFEALKRVRPSLSEPLQGATHYAVAVARTPKFDENFCKTIGKVISVMAIVPDGTTDPVTIRLDAKYMSMGAPEDGARFSPNPNFRTFTVHIPKDQINEEIRINLFLNTSKAVRTCETVWTVDLRNYGFFVFYDVGSVTFS